MQYIAYLFLRFVLGIVNLLPFWVLYLFADFLYLVLYKLIGYRTKVVRANLARVYPQLSDAERSDIERKFYRQFCDITVESLKGLTMSEAEAAGRWKVMNTELIDAFYHKKQSVILLGMHTANWEWGPICSPLQLLARVVVLYKPLSNPYIDAYIRNLRAHHNSEMRSTKETSKVFQEHENEPCAFAMVADQSPSNMKEAIWTSIMGVPTAMLHGVPKYAKQYGYPIIVYHTRRVKRGFYEITSEVMVENPTEMSLQAMADLFGQHIERDWRDVPSDWLWTHKRWKHEPPKEMNS